MKYLKQLFLIIISVLIITIIFVYFNPFVTSIKTPSNASVLIGSNNSSTINITIPATNVTINSTNFNHTNENLQPVNGDYVFNNINWSKYTNIDRICIHNNEVSGPNNVINHTHIWFSIDVNIKDPENTRELYREMAGIVMEIRQIIGPNSSPDVYGLQNGFIRYHVGMMPYEDRIYASDHYHPQAYKNEIYLIPGADIYDYHSYTLINNSVVEN